MVEGDQYGSGWLINFWMLLFYVCRIGAAWATDRAVDLAARRSAPATQDASRPSWEAEHPWRAALFDIWSLPLAALALVVIYPAPLELRGAFIVLLAVVTAFLAVCHCLNRSLKEKGYYAHTREEAGGSMDQK